MADAEPPATSNDAHARGPRQRRERAPREALNHDLPLPEFDESLLIRVKGKVKKPVRPDDTERNAAVEGLQAEIKRRSDRIAEIKAILAGRRNRTADPAAEPHKKRKDVLRREWQAVLKQKQHIKEDFNRCNTEKEVLRNSLRELRSKIPRGTRLDTLEADLAAVEYKLAHEVLSGNEEKKAQQQLTQLNTARPLGREAAVLEEKLKACETARAATKARLDQCDAVLNGIKEKEAVENAALDELRAQREGGGVDVPALEVERQENWEIIQAMRKQMDEVRDAFNQKWTEFKKLGDNYYIYMRHQKKAEYEERKAAREAREAEVAEGGDADAPAAAAPGEAREGREPRDRGPVPEPYEAEVCTLDQLITYLKKFGPAEGPAAEAEAKGPVEVPQGMREFKKKDADEDLSFFTSQQGGKGKGKKKSSKTASAAGAEPGKKKITHTIELLKTFMQFKLDVPNTTAEVPATLEGALAKKQDFLEKRKKAKEAPKPSASGSKASESKAEPVADAAEPEPEAEADTLAADVNGASPTAADKADGAADEISEELCDGPEASGKSVGLKLTADEQNNVTVDLTAYN